jgi:NADH-quinone oxidoreductase subunit J
MMDASLFLFWALTLLGLVGAAFVVFTRDVTRLILGLGAVFLSAAGLFALYGLGFLAMAELFVYVGGVLILMLFAIMFVHRPRSGSPELESAHDSVAAIACVGLFGLIVVALGPLVPSPGTRLLTSPDDLGALLLGDMLPQFELAGLLLLAALVAVVAIRGGDSQ